MRGETAREFFGSLQTVGPNGSRVSRASGPGEGLACMLARKGLGAVVTTIYPPKEWGGLPTLRVCVNVHSGPDVGAQIVLFDGPMPLSKAGAAAT